MRSLWPFKVPWSLWLHCEGKSLPVSHTFILLPAFSLSFCWCQAHSASCWVCQVCVRSEMLNHYLLFRDLPCVCRAARTSLGLCTTFAVVKYCTPTWKHKTTVNVFMHRHTQTHQYFLFFKIFWEYDFPPALLHTVAADVKSWFSAGKSLSRQVLWDSRGI